MLPSLIPSPVVHEVLSLKNIHKKFGNLNANHNISLSLKSGEVLALLGENGAGKTTLMNILFGHYFSDSGEIKVNGKILTKGSPKASIDAGLGMVHQHFTLADNLSVLDNIILGTQPIWDFRIQHGEANDKILALGLRFGLEVAPNARVSELSMGERQRVEILKALYRNAKILILDEPTAVLTPQESRTLFNTLRQLLVEGLSIIFISHKLTEVLEVSDRIAVLRDGELVTEVNAKEASEKMLAEAMVGRSFRMPIRKEVTAGESLLDLENVSVSGVSGLSVLDQVSFSVHAKEVVGLAGISGNGQRVLADLISGMQSPSSGKVSLYGKSVKRFHPREMLKQKVGRIPEDRQGFGVVGDMNFSENVITEVYKNPDYSKLGFLNLKNRQNFADKVVHEFDVRGVKNNAPVRLLSGGNMQKLILGRVLLQKPKLILAHQPARGLDIGAASFVYERLLDSKMQGCGILLISEDLEELLRISDRIFVIHRGKIIEAGKAGELSITNLGLYMAGRQADAS